MLRINRIKHKGHNRAYKFLSSSLKLSNSDNFISKLMFGYSKKLINMNDELIKDPDIIAIWLDTTDETYNGWTNYATWLIALTWANLTFFTISGYLDVPKFRVSK